MKILALLADLNRSTCNSMVVKNFVKIVEDVHCDKNKRLKMFFSTSSLIRPSYIYAILVILATAVTYYQLSGGDSGTLRWLRSLLDKLDLFPFT